MPDGAASSNVKDDCDRILERDQTPLRGLEYFLFAIGPLEDSVTLNLTMSDLHTDRYKA
jgi:hypothetical protein